MINFNLITFYVLSHPSQKQAFSQQYLCWTGGHASLSECWGTIDVVQNFGGQGRRVGMSADLKEEHVKSCPMTCTSGNSCTHKQMHFKGMAHLINAFHHPLNINSKICLPLCYSADMSPTGSGRQSVIPRGGSWQTFFQNTLGTKWRAYTYWHVIVHTWCTR